MKGKKQTHDFINFNCPIKRGDSKKNILKEVNSQKTYPHFYECHNSANILLTYLMDLYKDINLLEDGLLKIKNDLNIDVYERAKKALNFFIESRKLK